MMIIWWLSDDYIEELGEGWDKIIKEHEEHPLSPRLPRIESDEYSTTVTIFSTEEQFKEEEKEDAELNERQIKAFEYLKKRGKITNREYREINRGISESTALRDLEELTEKNIVVRKGTGRKTRYELV